jgi:YVTN family beta-propeller protein
MKLAWMYCAVWGIASVYGTALGQAPVERPGGVIELPSSKAIHGVVPGSPQRLNSLPVSMAVSPDGRWVVTVNGGYGSAESGYMQSVAVLDTRTGKVTDYPDARTLVESKQVLFSGMAFSADGKTLYGTIVSGTDPQGKNGNDTGSGVQVYGFADGRLTRQRVMKLPMEPLAPGHHTALGLGRELQTAGEAVGTKGLPYPAAIVDLPSPARQRSLGSKAAAGAGRAGEELLVASNLSDEVVELNPADGEVTAHFDLAESNVVPSTYPVALALAKDGKRAFVALWNASEVVELDLAKGVVGRKLPLLKPESPIAPGSHPTALVMSGDGRTLYVALGNRDSVAAVDLNAGGFKLKGYYDTRLPGQSFYGAQPEALTLNADGSRLYVANMGSDAVAVIDTRKLTKSVSGRGMAEPVGFIPTEWLPTGVAFAGGKIYIATGKGTGTGPNNFPQQGTPETQNNKRFQRPFTYIPTLLHGSLASIDELTVERELPRLTAETLADNRMKAEAERIAWNSDVANGGKGPIKHVIYIIKENRTYDQLFGDLTYNGKRVGNGDPSLTMYGEDITPNQHKLALQFGVLDNFYDSAEVSGDGHVWSNTAIGTDYLERTWQLNYRGGQHGYDYEGVVSQGIPLDQGIPDVNEPESGYIWGNLARHGLTLYHFGEFISTKFCTDKGISAAQQDSRQGPMLEGRACEGRNAVKPGEMLPAVWGGGVNRWHLAGWIADRQAGNDTMPNFIQLRLPNDHTGGTTPGGPTPKSSVADNDLAIGRAVEAISHSAYWADTAFFILEDDAQNGADHVDAHRSDGIVVSKYAPHGVEGGPFVDSRFYSTVSMVRTMETVLGLPPMNNNDALSSLISTLFTGPGDQAPFTADPRNRENGLIFQANPKNAPGARESAKMDFRHADRADAQKLNVILWEDAMGSKPVPSMLREKRKKGKKDVDDD